MAPGSMGRAVGRAMALRGRGGPGARGAPAPAAAAAPAQASKVHMDLLAVLHFNHVVDRVQSV